MLSLQIFEQFKSDTDDVDFVGAFHVAIVAQFIFFYLRRVN